MQYVVEATYIKKNNTYNISRYSTYNNVGSPFNRNLLFIKRLTQLDNKLPDA